MNGNNWKASLVGATMGTGFKTESVIVKIDVQFATVLQVIAMANAALDLHDALRNLVTAKDQVLSSHAVDVAYKALNKAQGKVPSVATTVAPN